MTAPTVLFVHNGFPGQFADLARTLMARGVTCVAIGESHADGLEGVAMIRYGIPRASTEGILPLAAAAEIDMIRGAQALAAGRRMLEAGVRPQVIVGHTGWGETQFLREAFPEAKQVLYPEIYPRPADRAFDPEFGQADEAAMLSAKARAATTALALTDADAIVCPTQFQAGTLPAAFRPRVRIIHEGVDTEAIRPGPAPDLALPDGSRIPAGTPVITHINNQLEPIRGLHILARALPRVLTEVPEAQAVIFGHEVSYGYSGQAPGSGSWKDACLAGVDLDPARVHFLGHVRHEDVLAMLPASAAHVYYSWPFVLSWSVIEAMAAGCHLIGSDTAPVREVIADGVNGRLLPFFDVDALSQALIAACRDPEASAPLRAAARRTAVEGYDRARGRAAWLALLAEMGLALPA